jgi:hypothetical protein
VRLLQLTAESPSLSKLREKVQKGNFLAFIDALISINMKIITKKLQTNSTSTMDKC